MESRSVSRVLSRTVIPLRRTSLHAFSNLPGSSAGHANGTLFGLAPSGVYLATDCCQPCGALLPHLFTLTGTCVLRRLFSAALSIGSRLPGVTWHFALRSPDFPPSHYRSNATATVRSTLRREEYGALTSTASLCNEKFTQSLALQIHDSPANAACHAQQQSRWLDRLLISNHR